ncbi:winged helix DNA-binding domain-containing protein [Actinokineospora sp. HUAS TT18]|uniref:winged helix DNA-binding domain-containing protein n=1 Tax=Actinokineospora sp. HUAS TT18 TaxID=3447451 RepID=UPI003F528642
MDSLVERTVSQGLAGPRGASVVDAVRRVVALQAQDVRANRLAVRARTEGLTRVDVDAAVADGTVVRTWAMRGTLHMLAAEDAPWIVALLGPRFAHGLRGRRAQLGLTDDICARGAEVIAEAAREPRSRAELVDALAGHGIEVDPRTQAPAHLIGYAAMTGVIRRGPDRSDDEPTYVLLEPADPLDEPKALARLAERYVEGHAPATAEDFAAWSGLPLGKARSAFTATAPKHDDPGRTVRLVGHFDAYLLGYRDRSAAVPTKYAKRIQAGGGFIMPAVLVDGRAVATWKRARGRVEIEPFDTLPKGIDDAIDAEIADIARFLADNPA